MVKVCHVLVWDVRILNWNHTRVDKLFAISLPPFDTCSLASLCILLGKDVPHGKLLLRETLVLDGRELEPVAVNNVKAFPTLQRIFDYVSVSRAISRREV